jgi:hypothetical protein
VVGDFVVWWTGGGESTKQSRLRWTRCTQHTVAGREQRCNFFPQDILMRELRAIRVPAVGETGPLRARGPGAWNGFRIWWTLETSAHVTTFPPKFPRSAARRPNFIL